jgi:hypothetical protein
LRGNSTAITPRVRSFIPHGTPKKETSLIKHLDVSERHETANFRRCAHGFSVGSGRFHPGFSLSNPVDSDSPNLGRDALSAALRSARPSTSAFHIGWRELTVGAWISRIQPNEYEMRATGWMRVAAGLQSLLSVYLIALWTLTYFGRPFQ